MPATLDEVVKGIRNLTASDGGIVATLEQANLANAVFQGPALAAAMTTYCQQMSLDLLQPLNSGTRPLNEDGEAELVANALRDFVAGALERNELFIVRAPVFARLGFAELIATNLRRMEASGNVLMSMLADHAYSRRLAIQEQAAIWSAGIGTILSVYDNAAING
ncbi:hypothetical protein OC835_006490 [Tilletia horrida]|nr:hypothetical protein OC835_006490 [Tilletia horrida]KAK0558183.1 hypothetical protein OC844_005351 [Tilletia horrida]